MLVLKILHLDHSNELGSELPLPPSHANVLEVPSFPVCAAPLRAPDSSAPPATGLSAVTR